MKKIATLFLCLTVAGAAAEPEGRALLQQGRALLFDGKTDQAIPILRKAVELDPKNIEAHATYQDARRLRDPEALLQEYAARAEKDPADADALCLHARLLAESNRLQECEALLQRCLALEPRHKRARIGAAWIHAQRGEFEKGAAICDDLLRNDPKDFNLLLFQVRFQMQRGDREAAASTLANAAQEVGENPFSKLDFCVATMFMNPAAGTEPLLKLLKEFPESPHALCHYGLLLTFRGKLKEAEEALLKAIRSEPNLADPHQYLGNLYSNTGRPELFRQEMEIYKRLSPGPVVGLQINERGEVRTFRGNVNEAALGALELQAWNLEKALHHYQEAARTDPSAFLNVADILLQLGKRQEAAQALQKAGPTPHRWWFHFEDGWRLLQAGQRQEARAAFQCAIEANPPRGRTRVFLERLAQSTAGNENKRACFLPPLHPPALKDKTCVPAAVATVLAYWDRPVDPGFASDLVEKGTTFPHIVEFMRGLDGFTTLPFQPTPSAVKSCVDQRIPVLLLHALLRWEGTRFAFHAAIATGYDDGAECLVTVDNNTWRGPTWLSYGDLQECLAFLLVPEGKPCDTKLLNIDEGRRLSDLVLSLSKDNEESGRLLAAPDAHPAESFLKISHLLNKKRWPEAAARLERILASMETAGLHFLLARVCHDMGQLDDETTHLRKALELDPSLLRARIELADLLVSKKRFSEAYAILEPANRAYADREETIVLAQLRAYLSIQTRRPQVFEENLRYLTLVSPDKTAELQHLAEKFEVSALFPHLLLSTADYLVKNLSSEDLWRIATSDPKPEFVRLATMALALTGNAKALEVAAQSLEPWQEVPAQSSTQEGAYVTREGILVCGDEKVDLKSDRRESFQLGGVGFERPKEGELLVFSKDRATQMLLWTGVRPFQDPQIEICHQVLEGLRWVLPPEAPADSREVGPWCRKNTQRLEWDAAAKRYKLKAQ